MGNKAYNKIKQKADAIKERVQAETPEHFKSTQKLGLYAAGFGLLLRIGGSVVPALAPLQPIGIDLFTHGMVIAGLSKTAKK